LEVKGLVVLATAGLDVKGLVLAGMDVGGLVVFAADVEGLEVAMVVCGELLFTATAAASN